MKNLGAETSLVSESRAWLGYMIAAESERRFIPANTNRPTSSYVAEATVDACWYAQHGKRALDVVLALLSLPLVLPILGLSALALWLESGNPFYGQSRLGKDGNRFTIYKLRTMVRGADRKLEEILAADPELRDEWDRTQKLKNDPRITPIGNLLRRTSIDELPQIVNVFRGEMSLVGPRPMLPKQLPLYATPAAYFALRPGLTGVWQVSTRNEDGFARRARLDTAYANSVSFWGDLKLITRTVGVVLRGTGY